MNDQVKTCEACGSSMPRTADFCPLCGRSVAGGVQVPAVVPWAGGGGAQPAGAGLVAGGPAWARGVEIASPGSRVASWFIEVIAIVAPALLVLAIIGGLAGSATSMNPGAGLATLFALIYVPQLIAAAAGTAVWIWEGRTGKRFGNLAMGIRTVEITAGGPPGLGKVFVSRLILGLVVVGILVVTSLLSEVAGGGFLGTIFGLIGVAAAVAAAGTGAFDQGPLRQGWHEKVSGTTMIRDRARAGSVSAGARLAAPPPEARPTPASAPATAARPTPAPAPLPDGRVAPQPVDAEAPTVAEPLPAPPTSRDDVPHAPIVRAGGLIAEVPGFERATEVGAPVVPTNEVDGTAEDDIEHTRISSRAPRRSALHSLSFDTGEVVHVTGPGLVGRDPEAGVDADVEHLVPIEDPERSVSKTHLAFGSDALGLWVEDKGSTNGTEVLVPGQAAQPVPPGQHVTVPDGATVRFGERSFTVRRG